MLMLRNMLKNTLKKRVKHWIGGEAITNSESIILKLDLLVVSIKHFSKYCLICIVLSVNILIAIRLSSIKIINNNSIMLSEQVVDVLENKASILSYVASYIIFYALFLYLWFIVGEFLLKEVSKNLAKRKKHCQAETKLFSSNNSREEFQLENKMNGVLVRVSLAATFLSYAGLIVFNETKDILIADISDTAVAYVTCNLQLLLNIVYYTACFMVWLLIGWYIIRYPQKFSKTKEILLFIKYLLLSNNWPTRILIFYVVILIAVFWLPALFPFIHISKSWFN